MCIVGPVMNAINFADTFTKVKTILGTVDEILSGNEQRHSEKPVLIKDHSIKMDNVSYSYHKGTQVLHDITLEVEAGKMTALVGPSGGGKSTIAKQLASYAGYRYHTQPLRCPFSP